MRYWNSWRTRRACFLPSSSVHWLSDHCRARENSSWRARRALQLLIKELRKREGIVSQEIIARDDSPLESPIDPDILAGNMAVMWLSDRKKIQIEIQEMKVNNISGEIDSPDFDNNDLGIEKDDLAMVRFALTLGQVKEFIRRSEAVIGSGRQPCMFCGLPINPDGHLCPRANGYRR
ncbi:MAG: DUF3090 family protein [Actinobacteria bacterium]|nr:DUF3090 family protein [Actinomycetota bacterium]